MKSVIAKALIVLIIAHVTASREVTHEDIRDAMLSLVKIVKTSEDKLDRHEIREKALGELLKKSLANLEKRAKSPDPLKGAISRLDERLSNVETILIQKNETETRQAQQMADVVNAEKQNLQTIVEMLRAQTASRPAADDSTAQKLNAVEDKLMKKLDDVTSYLGRLEKKIDAVREHQHKGQDDCKKNSLNEQIFTQHMSETEKLLTRYETKLSEYDTNMTKIQMEIVPLGEISLADEAWHSKMTEALEKQQQSIQMIQKSLINSEEVVKRIPTQADLQKYKNQTLEAIRNTHYDMVSSCEKGTMKITSELVNMKKQNEASFETLTGPLSELTAKNEKVFSEIANSYEKLRSDVQSIAKVERVIVQTADNVMDSKRRVEYGIREIISELSEDIKLRSNELNNTLDKRFSDVQAIVLNNQTNALKNLSNKVEHEMSQVWRQIGIMHQQLTTSNYVLDRLQNQTEQYVNSSVSSMDGMEGKVGMITKRMLEVDDNLNFLLGRLSIVTQEFNQIRTGLGNALDEIKKSFLEVHNKIKEAGPGPHYIKQEE